MHCILHFENKTKHVLLFFTLTQLFAWLFVQLTAIFKYIYIQETKSNAIYSFTCLDPTLPKKITYHKFPITDVVLKVTKWYKAKHCYCEGNLFFQITL